MTDINEETTEPDTTDNLLSQDKKQRRLGAVSLACQLLSKGFTIPEDFVNVKNPINQVADWIEEALNTEAQSSQSSRDKHLLPKNLYDIIDKVAVMSQKSFDDIRKKIKRLEAEDDDVIRNTNLVNQLIADKLSTAISIELDLIGQNLERPRITPESDDSYRRRLLTPLAIRKLNSTASSSKPKA